MGFIRKLQKIKFQNLYFYCWLKWNYDYTVFHNSSFWNRELNKRNRRRESQEREEKEKEKEEKDKKKEEDNDVCFSCIKIVMHLIG